MNGFDCHSQYWHPFKIISRHLKLRSEKHFFMYFFLIEYGELDSIFSAFFSVTKGLFHVFFFGLYDKFITCVSIYANVY